VVADPDTVSLVNVPTPQPTHKLTVTRNEAVLLSLHLSEGDSAVIGRSPAAQVAINDPRMSRMHAMIWVQGGAVWVRDLGSTNGTHLNGKRIGAPVSLPDTALLQIGGATIQINDEHPSRPALPMLWLEESKTSLRRSISCVPLTLPGGGILYRNESGVWLDRDGTQQALSIGDGIDIGEQHWRLVDADGTHHSTDVSGQNGLPYSLAWGHRERLVMQDPSNHSSHIVGSSRRTSLLRALAENLQRDREQGQPREQQGWTADRELGQAVWGDAWLNNGSNRLNVLIHRVRRALQDDGFNPDCIQKQRGAARLWIQRVHLEQI